LPPNHDELQQRENYRAKKSACRLAQSSIVGLTSVHAFAPIEKSFAALNQG
jgi:hypothetical protein